MPRLTYLNGRNPLSYGIGDEGQPIGLRDTDAAQLLIDEWVLMRIALGESRLAWTNDERTYRGNVSQVAPDWDIPLEWTDADVRDAADRLAESVLTLARMVHAATA